MGDRDSNSILGLLVLKAICCGGLLLATGAISVGGLVALVNHPATRTVALIAVLWGAWKLASAVLVRRTGTRTATDVDRADERGRRVR